MKGFAIFALILLVGVAPWLAGCAKQPQAVVITSDATSTPRDTSERPRDILVPMNLPNDSGLYRDSETGCQYFSSWGHGLTARMVWDEKRQTMLQMGCHITEYEGQFVNPTTGK